MRREIVSQALALAMLSLLFKAEAPFAQTSSTSKTGVGTPETALRFSTAMQCKEKLSPEVRSTTKML